jgi:hypothetical protein
MSRDRHEFDLDLLLDHDRHIGCWLAISACSISTIYRSLSDLDYFSILVGHIEKTSVAVENHRSNHQMTVAAAMLSIDSSETDKIFAPRPL